MNSYFLNSAGNLHLGLRRFLFGFTAVSLCACAATAVTEYAGKRSEYETLTEQNTTNMEKPQLTFAGIESGKIYEAQTPATTQSMQGALVLNDRKVIELTPNGPHLLETEVHFVTAASDVPQKETVKEFMHWVGREVTDSMPPANGPGQAGDGKDWRPAAGGGVPYNVSQAAPAPTPEVSDVNNTDARVAHVEAGEGGPDKELTAANVTEPTIDALTVAKAAEPEAKPTELSKDAVPNEESLRARTQARPSKNSDLGPRTVNQ